MELHMPRAATTAPPPAANTLTPESLDAQRIALLEKKIAKLKEHHGEIRHRISIKMVQLDQILTYAAAAAAMEAEVDRVATSRRREQQHPERQPSTDSDVPELFKGILKARSRVSSAVANTPLLSITLPVREAELVVASHGAPATPRAIPWRIIDPSDPQTTGTNPASVHPPPDERTKWPPEPESETQQPPTLLLPTPLVGSIPRKLFAAVFPKKWPNDPLARSSADWRPSSQLPSFVLSPNHPTIIDQAKGDADDALPGKRSRRALHLGALDSSTGDAAGDAASPKVNIVNQLLDELQRERGRGVNCFSAATESPPPRPETMKENVPPPPPPPSRPPVASASSAGAAVASRSASAAVAVAVAMGRKRSGTPPPALQVVQHQLPGGVTLLLD